MGVLDRFERGIERAVNGVFARAFRSEVQPVEIASALRRRLDDRAAVVARGRTLVPNAFVVELGRSDFERTGEYTGALADELVTGVREYARSQQYAFVGPVTVDFEEAEDLDTGVFRVRSGTAKASAPAAAAHRGSPPPGASGSPYAAAPPAPSSPAPPPVAPPQPPPAREPDTDATAAHPGPSAPDQGAGGPLPRPWLEVDGRRHLLESALTVVGRGEDAGIALDDPGVSRRHAVVRVSTDSPRAVAHLSDLGSTNGTFVDGRRVEGAVLADGQVVTVGRTRMVYRTASPEPSSPGPSRTPGSPPR